MTPRLRRSARDALRRAAPAPEFAVLDQCVRRDAVLLGSRTVDQASCARRSHHLAATGAPAVATLEATAQSAAASRLGLQEVRLPRPRRAGLNCWRQDGQGSELTTPGRRGHETSYPLSGWQQAPCGSGEFLSGASRRRPGGSASGISARSRRVITECRSRTGSDRYASPANHRHRRSCVVAEE